MTIFPVKRASGTAYRVTVNKVNVGTFTGPHAKKRAREAEAEYIMRLREGPAEAPGRTIAAWREEWLSDYRDRPDTRRHYEERTRSFVKAHGDELLAEFTPRQAKRWAVEHRSTVSVIKTMFNAAYKDDVIEKFPWKNVDTPKYVRDIEPGWLSLEDVTQLAALAHRTREDPYGAMVSAMVTVAAWTGIRPGELFAIGPGDLNRERHELRIRQAVNSKTKALKKPKNGYARTVVIAQPAIDAIDASRAAYEFAMAGRPEPAEPTLFVTVTGRRLSVASWTASYWGPLRVLFGRPSMEWYELRHFGATVLLNAGASYEDVAHQLGQSDTDLIRRVYGHPEAVRTRARIHDAMRRAQLSDVKTGTGDAPIIELPRRLDPALCGIACGASVLPRYGPAHDRTGFACTRCNEGRSDRPPRRRTRRARRLVGAAFVRSSQSDRPHRRRREGGRSADVLGHWVRVGHRTVPRWNGGVADSAI